MRLYQGRCRDLLPPDKIAVPRLRGMPEAPRSAHRPGASFFGRRAKHREDASAYRET